MNIWVLRGCSLSSAGILLLSLSSPDFLRFSLPKFPDMASKEAPEEKSCPPPPDGSLAKTITDKTGKNPLCI